MCRFIIVAMLFCSIAMPGVADIVLNEGFVRAMPPGQKMTAAYLSITNSGAGEVIVSVVSSNIAARVEIHESYARDGMMTMRQLPAVSVPAGGRLALVPGGMHLMLFDIDQQLKEGGQVQITLQYGGGASQQFSLPVRRQASISNHHGHH